MLVVKNRIRELVETYQEKNKQGDKKPSQAEIAVMMTLNPSVLSRYMNDDVQRYDSDVIGKIAGFFDITDLSEILYLERA